MAEHRSTLDLAAALDHIAAAPADGGIVEMILTRPSVGARKEVESAHLTAGTGLEGDSWAARPGAEVDRQLTLMGSRSITAIAGGRENWAPAGDNLFVDLDLSAENVPPGTRLKLGEAVIEITAPPHAGCDKFIERYGRAACVFVNTGRGRELRMRGVNARVVRDGVVSRGDRIGKAG